MEKVGRDEPPLSVVRGENQTPFGKSGYARFGSGTAVSAAPLLGTV
jgi:hypothetical protein